MKCGRLLPLLLSLLLSVSLLAPAALARETEFFPDFPEPVPASAQDWSPADVVDLMEQLTVEMDPVSV